VQVRGCSCGKRESLSEREQMGLFVVHIEQMTLLVLVRMEGGRLEANCLEVRVDVVDRQLEMVKSVTSWCTMSRIGSKRYSNSACFEIEVSRNCISTLLRRGSESPWGILCRSMLCWMRIWIPWPMDNSPLVGRARMRPSAFD